MKYLVEGRWYKKTFIPSDKLSSKEADKLAKELRKETKDMVLNKKRKLTRKRIWQCSNRSR